MSSTISHQIKNKSKPNDVFYTPTSLVKQATHITHQEVERFLSLDPMYYLYKTGYKAPDIVWYDPFYGNGQFYINFGVKEKIWSEIEMGKDFFKTEVEDSWDDPLNEEFLASALDPSNPSTKLVICSNPPYSMIDKVLEKTVGLRPAVITYVLAMHGLTPKRMQFMEKHGYHITAIHMCKVFKWYGMSAIVSWNYHQYQITPYDELGDMNVALSYDREVHKYKSDE